jgi:hypothetical protein
MDSSTKPTADVIPTTETPFDPKDWKATSSNKLGVGGGQHCFAAIRSVLDQRQYSGPNFDVLRTQECEIYAFGLLDTVDKFLAKHSKNFVPSDADTEVVKSFGEDTEQVEMYLRNAKLQSALENDEAKQEWEEILGSNEQLARLSPGELAALPSVDMAKLELMREHNQVAEKHTPLTAKAQLSFMRVHLSKYICEEGGSLHSKFLNEPDAQEGINKCSIKCGINNKDNLLRRMRVALSPPTVYARVIKVCIRTRVPNVRGIYIPECKYPECKSPGYLHSGM